MGVELNENSAGGSDEDAAAVPTVCCVPTAPKLKG